MRISFDVKGDFNNVEAWLKKVATRGTDDAVRKIAEQGTKSLSANTPKNTGETAAGWSSKITKSGDVTEVAWINTAHPEAGVNLAKLIDLGHGTGTGGYVPPQPYVKKSMSPIWNSTDGIIRELIK